MLVDLTIIPRRVVEKILRPHICWQLAVNSVVFPAERGFVKISSFLGNHLCVLDDITGRLDASQLVSLCQIDLRSAFIQWIVVIRCLSSYILVGVGDPKTFYVRLVNRSSAKPEVTSIFPPSWRLGRLCSWSSAIINLGPCEWSAFSFSTKPRWQCLWTRNFAD